MTRLNKYMADNNLASRREADELIARGAVYVNGKKAIVGMQIGSSDTVEVRTNPKTYTYLLYNKPRGVVTVGAQRGEKAIRDVAPIPKDVFPIGRLDKESEGLLLLTNDRRITGKILEPEYNHEKEYIVTVNKPIGEQFLSHMARGVKLPTYRTKHARVKKLGPQTFSITLTEGKNRQIRKMCEALGFSVQELKRIRIMDFTIGSLKPNQARELSKRESLELLHTIGITPHRARKNR